MIIQILDKLAMLNNKMMDSPDHGSEKGQKIRISADVSKYLSFFELFIHNRFNLLLLQQLNASTYLFELLKYFMSRD